MGFKDKWERLEKVKIEILEVKDEAGFGKKIKVML